MSPFRWRSSHEGERGVLVAQAAILMAIFLPLSLVAADLATAGLRLYVGQNAATTVAATIAQGIDPADSRITDELERAECDLGSVTITEPVVLVHLECRHVSVSTVLPDTLGVDASAVLP